VSYYDRPEGLRRALCPFCGARLRTWDWDPNDSTEAEEPPLRRPVYWREVQASVEFWVAFWPYGKRELRWVIADDVECPNCILLMEPWHGVTPGAIDAATLRAELERQLHERYRTEEAERYRCEDCLRSSDDPNAFTSVVVDDVERTFCLGCYITRKYAAGVDDEDSEAIQRRL
jgi:hypothetical protein